MPKVFEESVLAGLTLSSRIIRSATHEGMAGESGRPIPQLSDLYLRLARGGVGAIITGYAAVQENGRTLNNMLMMDKDELVDDYRKLLKPVNDYGTPVIMQLAHGGGQIDPDLVKVEAVAPSKMKYPLNEVVARALSEAEIEEIIKNFVQAISRAKGAGFDGVQLHAAHGYLLSEFLSPCCNKRTDQWGGNTENRFRIINEIIVRARKEVGSYPILMKINAYDADKNGMTKPEAISIAKLFEEAGGDALEVSSGGIALGFHPVRMTAPPVEAIMNLHHRYREKSAISKRVLSAMLPLMIKNLRPLHNYNIEAAAEIKKHLKIPIIVVGGIRDIDTIEKILEEEKADYVSLCRPFIIEPNLVNHFKDKKQETSKCIDCGYCLIGVVDRQLRCYHGKILRQMEKGE
ncbi:MAG: NADH:flavin oxidoreductase [Bacillota bacterium]|nr:NADH:flavin oxidoreductase [Bacillota bacterium]